MNYAKIPVRTFRSGMKNVLVDAIDSNLKRFAWHQGKTGGYPRRSTKRTIDGRQRSVTFYLHREIAELDPGDPTFQVHHANHDIFDCRRANLWICTPAFNARHQKRELVTMFEELSDPRGEIECWPLAHPEAALAHILRLHLDAGGRNLKTLLPLVYSKLGSLPDPRHYAITTSPLTLVVR